MTVTVNPTSLTPGSYSGTITINTVPPGSNPAVVAVTLSISNPPSTLMVTSTSTNYTPASSGASSPTLTFTYTTGALTTTPAQAQLDVASNGDIIPFNVTASHGRRRKAVAARAGMATGERLGPTREPADQRGGAFRVVRADLTSRWIWRR